MTSHLLDTDTNPYLWWFATITWQDCLLLDHIVPWSTGGPVWAGGFGQMTYIGPFQPQPIWDSAHCTFRSKKASLLLGLCWKNPWNRLKWHYFLFVVLSMIVHPFDVSSKLTEVTETFQGSGRLDNLAMQEENLRWELVVHCLNRETESSESCDFFSLFFNKMCNLSHER